MSVYAFPVPEVEDSLLLLLFSDYVAGYCLLCFVPYAFCSIFHLLPSAIMLLLQDGHIRVLQVSKMEIFVFYKLSSSSSS